MNRDFHELITMVRPPAPEMSSAERQARQRQQIFHSHQPGEVPHQTPMNTGPVERADVCVMDERGGHRSMGVNCPHFQDWDRDHVEVVEF